MGLEDAHRVCKMKSAGHSCLEPRAGSFVCVPFASLGELPEKVEAVERGAEPAERVEDERNNGSTLFNARALARLVLRGPDLAKASGSGIGRWVDARGFSDSNGSTVIPSGLRASV